MCASSSVRSLDASISVAGPNGQREIPAHEFFLEPGSTPEREHPIDAADIILGIMLPNLPYARNSTYVKARDRAQYEFALASAAVALEMQGGTTFHFVTGGIHEALERARAAANGKDVRIGGGASTIRQYLRARLIDELHLAISPVLLGAGESLFEGIDARALGYECAKFVATEKATHVILRRSAA